jgi:hypothetical protein
MVGDLRGRVPHKESVKEKPWGVPKGDFSGFSRKRNANCEDTNTNSRRILQGGQ